MTCRELLHGGYLIRYEEDGELEGGEAVMDLRTQEKSIGEIRGLLARRIFRLLKRSQSATRGKKFYNCFGAVSYVTGMKKRAEWLYDMDQLSPVTSPLFDTVPEWETPSVFQIIGPYERESDKGPYFAREPLHAGIILTKGHEPVVFEKCGSQQLHLRQWTACLDDAERFLKGDLDVSVVPLSFVEPKQN